MSTSADAAWFEFSMLMMETYTGPVGYQEAAPETDADALSEEQAGAGSEPTREAEEGMFGVVRALNLEEVPADELRRIGDALVPPGGAW